MKLIDYAIMGGLVAVILVAATGCAAVDGYRAVVAEQGADAADQTLESAEWAICNAASAGAVKRRYNTPEKRAAYAAICPNGGLE